jgi:hypothetical protein
MELRMRGNFFLRAGVSKPNWSMGRPASMKIRDSLKKKFDSLEKENFDSLKLKNLTVCKGIF